MRPFIPFRDPGLEALKAVAEFAMIVVGCIILLFLSPIIIALRTKNITHE